MASVDIPITLAIVPKASPRSRVKKEDTIKKGASRRVIILACARPCVAFRVKLFTQQYRILPGRTRDDTYGYSL